jgi:hypothetical protein
MVEVHVLERSPLSDARSRSHGHHCHSLVKRCDFVVVTGGEDFIGRHVRTALANSGQLVISVDSRFATPNRGEQLLSGK